MIVLLNDYLGLEESCYPNLIYYNLADESSAKVYSSTYKEHVITRISRRPIWLCNLKHYCWVIDCMRESHDSRICNIVYKVLLEIGIPYNQILFLVSVDESPKNFLGQTIFCHSWYSKFHDHYVMQTPESSIKNKLFVCAIRRGHPPRMLLAKKIQEQNWNKNFYTLSVNSINKDSGVHVDGWVHAEKVHDVVFMQNSLVNIIVETSSDTEILKYNSFLTEKTFKCFALKQIPIWYGHNDLYITAKKLGFDIFEDIFEHAAISRSTSWIEKSDHVIDFLDRWATKNPKDWQDLYDKIEPRLKHNQDLAKYYQNVNFKSIARKIKSWHDLVTQIP